MEYLKALKIIREKIFLTQKELAELLDVSFENINRWKNEKFSPSMKIKERIHEICQKNNIDLTEF